uniref:Peptide transporter imqJ n=1 Tax=Aspergillus flavus (strain ATCC 200026 / FGSC A1120 / IAM 13836 / NRRL 3357 / JCM 12722 / SRRC 167) TaxID=332952 RepID=IMQJ_ASPFN|nr:RecName: Full=Peptide transporter imqJ; AltName: Full=Imizoquin biosynthesis cluster protein J [Aspergillus flavus NRRL3357]
MVNQAFMLWCYITPVLGAVVAEQYIGRVKTIIFSSSVYLCGLVTLFLSSLPTAYAMGISLPGLLVSLFLIGIGTGGIKTNVSSLIAEQYTGPKESRRILKSGEEVIVDRDLTIQRIFTTFFLYINIGSFSPLLITIIEKEYGFSAAFSLSAITFSIGFIIVLVSRHLYISRDPDSSIIFNACKAFWIAIKHKGNLDYARPSYQTEQAATRRLSWDDSFIDDLRRAIASCKIFILYPIYWAAYSQFLTNFISQAATMETHGVPNDIMTNIDPITVLILLPVLDRIVFPFLRRQGVPVRHVDRITIGMPDFQPFVQESYQICQRTCFQIISAIELGLGLQAGRLTQCCQPAASEIRLLYYPPTTKNLFDEGLKKRAWPHTDLGIITLLFQDMVGGLEVEDRAAGKPRSFIPVKRVSPNEMIVNTSDSLQRWTNNVIRAGLHQVTAPDAAKLSNGVDMLPARCSSVFFFKAGRDTSVGPLPEFVTEDRPAAFEDMTALQYQQLKTRILHGVEG